MQLLNTPLLEGYVLVNIDKQPWSNFDLPTFAFGCGIFFILTTTLAQLKVVFIFRYYQFIFTMIWKNLGSHISCSCTNMYKNCHVLDKLQEGLSLDCENDG